MFALTIKKAMKDREISAVMLSEKTKIPYSSLAYMLDKDSFKISALKKIAKILDYQLILKKKNDRIYTKDDMKNFADDIIEEITFKKNTIDK